MEKSRYDQYFMTSEKYIDLISSYGNLSSKDVVVEVGAGLGHLTRKIAPKAGKIFAIEKDPELIPIVEDNLSSCTNVEVIKGDALRMDWPDHNKIISNAPYSISRDLTVKALEEGFELAVLTFQKEYVEKLLAPSGSERYRFISALVQSTTEVEGLDKIPNDAFEPRPPVLSQITRLRDTRPVEKNYVSFVSRLFNQRGKKIKNILEGIDVPERFKHLRPNKVSPQDILALFKETRE
ncbi:rRNA adenine N-6-methyltransferase family protein [Candidatus Altiarchaeota archaeon]